MKNTRAKIKLYEMRISEIVFNSFESLSSRRSGRRETYDVEKSKIGIVRKVVVFVAYEDIHRASVLIYKCVLSIIRASESAVRYFAKCTFRRLA